MGTLKIDYYKYQLGFLSFSISIPPPQEPTIFFQILVRADLF